MWYAHSIPGRPPSEWEPLYTGTGDGHLEKVAELGAEFADKFGAAEWGRVAGLWHDVGKFSAEFQGMLLLANGIEAHLETQPGRVDHSTAGAQHAVAEDLVDAQDERRASFQLARFTRIPFSCLVDADFLATEQK